MVIYRLPSDEGKTKSGSSYSDAKKPDYIYVNEGADEGSSLEHEENEEGFQKIQQLKNLHFSYGVRLFTAFFCFLAFIFTCVSLVFCAVSGAISAALLFRNEICNRAFQRYWKWLRRGAAVALGLFVGIFSPNFGYAILLIYFMLQGEQFENSMVSNFVYKE